MSSSCAPSSDLPNEEASLTALAAVAVTIRILLSDIVSSLKRLLTISAH